MSSENDIAIRVENLSKMYRLGTIGTGTLSHDLNLYWHKLRGKGNPYARVGEENKRDEKGESDYVWALRDINFEVKKGEIVGIIGKNGAGKSTLLKILSRITGPTEGRIKVNGRMASLLEVGTGFHPELTGRENIYLNGAIMGMTKREITSKLDEIIDFSGCARYIDTPVKRYSSGMTVRLGFAVAAFLEPEILIVDEVLAVGDAEFQKKAIGKMQEVSKGEGRTVLFVSHNLTSIENLCTKLLLLKTGMVNFHGNVLEGITKYNAFEIKEENSIIPFFDKDFELLNFSVKQDSLSDNFLCSEKIIVSINYKIKRNILGLRIGYDVIESSSNLTVFRSFHDDLHSKIEELKGGTYLSTSEIPSSLLNQGCYKLCLCVGIHNVRWIIHDRIYKKFNVLNIGGINKIYADQRPGIILPSISWSTYKEV
jgi:lipopolysaccharide transport system ATP-binding protein